MRGGLKSSSWRAGFLYINTAHDYSVLLASVFQLR